MPRSRAVPLLTTLLLHLATAPSGGQEGPWSPNASHNTEIYDSGGGLMAAQAAYDVEHYDIALRISPSDSTIAGSGAVHVRAAGPLGWLVVDLDTVFAVDSVTSSGPGSDGGRLAFHRGGGGKLWIDLGRTVAPGDRAGARVWYGGRPLVAPRWGGTWSDGFAWARTADGRPWVGLVSVLDGADIWFPVKDHPSDEPDSVDLHITVPGGLMVASNGRSRGVEARPDGEATHHWHVSTPVNNYGLTVMIAPYEVLETDYTSVTGETVPFRFWVLPEHLEAGRRLFPQMQAHLRWFEETLGPYPFRRDKYGVAETPYLGMETQSVIAYGADFTDNPFGYDQLHFHELAHEWFANLVTARDWKDWWIHEGFATYLQALYAEDLQGTEAYHRAVPQRPWTFRTDVALAPHTIQRTRDIYGGHIYSKGAAVLHTLRYLIGREALMASLRGMTYPDGVPAEGCGCRLVDTEDFRRVAEGAAGRDLAWFFDAYVHQAALPVLRVERAEGRLRLTWEVPPGLHFPMPVEVDVDGERRRLNMRTGRGELRVAEGADVTVDPDRWLLMDVDESTGGGR